MIHKKDTTAKINPTLLVQTFAKDLDNINSKGGIKTKCSQYTRLEIATFLADTPCRAQFLNVLQHIGTFPCHRCHIEKVNKEIPILLQSELIPKTLDEVLVYARLLEETRNDKEKRTNWKGVKGKSVFNRFGFDYIRYSPMKIMHCLFLGVVKNSLKIYIFDSKIKKLNETQIRLVDERIKMLKPPSNSKRSIRKLVEFPHFKSAEFEMLFYYGYFIFKGFFNENRFN